MSETKTNDKATKSGFIVKSEFRDKDDFNLIYEVGQDVSHLDAERLESLVALGLITKKSVK